MAGVYVHIPFCHAKCAYCDFFSTPRMERAREVADGIMAEYHARLVELAGEEITTVYFGGGTPSALDAGLLERICNELPMATAVERTIEVNPEDVDEQSAVRWLGMGFNRVSMGVQSLADSELRAVGRRHSAADALSAIGVLRRAGFDNISCDLIYGLPGQSVDTWLLSLRTLLAAGVEHLSAYSLSYEPGTRLTAMLQTGKITPTDDDTVAAMYAQLCDTARVAGFEHYEISNFARPGFRSRHNSAYWTTTPYLGLGPGAHSCDAHGLRRVGPANITAWLADGAQREEENATERLNDRIITGLRTADGLDMAALSSDDAAALLHRAIRYLDSGFVTAADGHMRIPEEHWIVSDGIMCDLLA